MPKLTIFEDAAVGHLKPLVHTRAAFDLRAGIFSFKERIERMLHREADCLVCRKQVSAVVAESHPGCLVNPDAKNGSNDSDDRTLFVNGRWIPERGDFLEMLRAVAAGDGPDQDVAWISDGAVVAAWGDVEAADRRDAGAARLVSRLWHLITDPGPQISRDAVFFEEEVKRPAQCPDLTMVHEEQIRLHPSAEFGAGVILNASAGPVVIESEAIIGDGAILVGPCHIGSKARLKMAARVSRSSIGHNSRAGGEISRSILHAHANKAHDGYLGNSYLGEWCNIGADANTSNLRNDYGTITLYNEEIGAHEDTGEQFVGLIMGDHSACGINTMFNTGTVVGVCCNVFGAGYQPRYVKSFSWGSRDRMLRLGFDKALQAATAMMTRRGRSLSQADKELLAKLSEASK
ncbi:MAG: putative sugar nucleotidyl transferase [Rhodothermia bacterium]